MTMKSCPYCAEDVQAEALRCPHCRSRLRTFAVQGWYREQPGKMVAGVASAVSQALGLPLALVRGGFVILAFLHLLGLIAYGVLWLIIPKDPGEPSILEGLLGRAQGLARRLSGREDSGTRRSRVTDGSDSLRIALNERSGER